MSDVLTRLNAALEGRYRVDSQLGEGGMATVYLADDLRHERKVALKVLKPELAAVMGADRFLTEIKTTANLQHPHILPLFDSGEADGFLFYVMPYVEGETLRARIDRDKQLGVEEAVRIAKAVAAALDYAHRQGVIHRDVKPENVLLHDGEPLVADFGIALAVSAAGGGRLTETGLSLGTPYYMSPEQAAADRDPGPQSDVYSLACILYEMLIGDPPHTGSSAQAVLAKILTEKPRAVTDLRETVPPHIGSAIARGLERLPADRFPTASAFSDALDDASFAHLTTATAAAVAPGAPVPRSSRRWMSLVPWGIAAVAAVAAFLPRSGANEPAPVTRVRLEMEAGQEFSKFGMGPNIQATALSPDGSELIYPALDTTTSVSRLMRRPLDALEATPVPGTSRAFAPAFSRDGRHLAFWASDDLRIGVMPAEGGTPQWIEGPPMFAWGDDGAIYYEWRDSIRRWSPGTAEAEIVGSLGPIGNVSDVLPGSRALLTSGGPGVPDMYAWDRESGVARPIGVGKRPRYLGTGHILYRRTEDDALIVQSFDPSTLQTTGPAIATSARLGASGRTGAEYTVADDGTLVYAGGGASGFEQLVWVDRSGASERIEWLEPGRFDGLALSASGDSVVAGWSPESSSEGSDIWLFDLSGRSRLPLTRNGVSARPQWHPTRPVVTYNGQAEDGAWWVMELETTGSGVARPIVRYTGGPSDAWWTRDGSELLLRMRGASLRSIFRYVPGQDSTPTPWLDRDFNERSPAPSPDGSWLVYASDQSGRDEVYAQPYPGGGRVESISIDGGSQPGWSRDGREIFFIGADEWMWSASVRYDRSTFTVESRERLFEIDPGIQTDAQRRLWDRGPDGRFLFIMRDNVGSSDLILVRNWVQEVTGAVTDR